MSSSVLWNIGFLIIIQLNFGSGINLISSPPVISVTANPSGRYFGPRVTDVRGNINLTILKDNTYVVPSAVGELVLDCNASYPVMWNLAESDINSEMFPYVNVRTKRFASDLFDPTSFNYSTQMILEGPSNIHKFTGNYTCQNTAKRNIKSNVFIYWEGPEMDTLVHSKETLTVYIKNDDKLTLPCGISNPNLTKPKLKKQEDRNRRGPFNDITQNKSITYNTATGFTLNNFPNPLGVYKCSVDEVTEDIVNIVVKNATTSRTVRKPNATFTYDPETNEVVCCSSSKRAPNIFMMHCDHAVTCQYREHVIEPYHYIFSRAKKSRNCARKIARFYHTVLIRCVGDGIDEYKEMITPVTTSYGSYWQPYNKTNKPKIFFSWEQIESQEMVSLEIHSKNSYGPYYYHPSPESQSNMVLYNKEQVDVTCTTSQYYFSEGNYWAIRWKNKTLTPITEQNSVSTHHYLLQSDMASFTFDTTMEAIVCFAPVWNSSVWVMKNRFLYINNTVQPVLLQNETLDFTWITNETSKEITCEAKGSPDPSFSWQQGNTVIDYNKHNYNITTTTTKTNETSVVKSILKINRVSYSTHGQFICTASNYGGKVTRSFRITVIEPSSMKTALIVIISIIVVLILAIIIFVVLRVMKIDQKAIRQLASVHFKDSGTREQVVNTDATNTTYDNGKWTNQLIS